MDWFLAGVFALHLTSVPQVSTWDEHYSVHPGYSLESSDIDSKTTVQSTCECVTPCIVKRNCSAVTVRYESNYTKCYFSDHSILSSTFRKGFKSTTYVMNPACDSSFELAMPLGCLHLSSKEMPHDQANSSCPAGSSLFSPTSGDELEYLSSFMVSKAERKSNMASKFWIDDTNADQDWFFTKNIDQTFFFSSLVCPIVFYLPENDYFYDTSYAYCRSTLPIICRKTE